MPMRKYSDFTFYLWLEIVPIAVIMMISFWYSSLLIGLAISCMFPVFVLSFGMYSNVWTLRERNNEVLHEDWIRPPYQLSLDESHGKKVFIRKRLRLIGRTEWLLIAEFERTETALLYLISLLDDIEPTWKDVYNKDAEQKKRKREKEKGIEELAKISKREAESRVKVYLGEFHSNIEECLEHLEEISLAQIIFPPQVFELEPYREPSFYVSSRRERERLEKENKNWTKPNCPICNAEWDEERPPPAIGISYYLCGSGHVFLASDSKFMEHVGSIAHEKTQ